MPDVLQETFDIQVDGETYTFKIPSIRFRFEVGGRATDIRRKAYPVGMSNEQMGMIDNQVWAFSRSCALLELYLVKSSAPWVYGSEDVSQIDLAKPPIVDFEKFPSGREDTIDAIGIAFNEEMSRFRPRRNPA